jgi:hypothetical protein
MSNEERHKLLSKLSFTEQQLFPDSKDQKQPIPNETIQTIAPNNAHNSKMIRKKTLPETRTLFIITSTSWTIDEDFTILLNVLLKLEKYLSLLSLRSHLLFEKALCVITGKGEMKASLFIFKQFG